MNILAVGAHPDDVELFCAGTLLKYKQQGHSIYIGLTTSGNQGSNVIESREEIARIRENEQLEAAQYYDAKVRFMRYDDELLFDTPETRRAVINTIRWANPDVIFTHYPDDPSTDHGMTGKIVSEVILSLPGKNIQADEPSTKKKPTLFFWDTTAGVDFLPEVYVDISDVMDLKCEALSKHESHKEWMSHYQTGEFFEHCRILGSFRGLQVDCTYAEGFRAHRIHGYMPDFKLLP